jgi:superfamily II DNA or RNA helicase
MEKAAIYGDTVETYKRLADGKQTIVYCASVKASKETARAFVRAGYTSVHLDGETPQKERIEAVEAFRRGEINVLCNVDLFGEGFDVPDCGCVILLRPTKSLSLFIQQSMRSMRYREGKHALIIDHVGNVFEHGLPDDAREWTLVDKKRKAKNAVHIRECPICFAVIPATAGVCSYCGNEFSAKDRKHLEVLDGEIVEISAEEIERRRLRKLPYEAYKKMRTFDEIRDFADARGYKFMWAVRKAHEIGVLPKQYMHLVRRFCS